MARNQLIDFCCYTLETYQPANHLRIIADKLEGVARGDINRLMIFAPPRHGKSELASVRFPAWYLAHNPQAQIIGASYSDALAYSNSFAVRACIDSHQFQMLWDMGLDRPGATRWQLSGKLNNRASYISSGVGGGITGEGADLMIIDDPIKNREEAESAVMREKIWDWYRTVARTRMQPGGAIVLIMTRWHVDDLAGKLLKQAQTERNADQWTVVHLKAIDNNQALWPEQYPMYDLQTIKASIGSREFTALYQGSPTEAEGNIFKREWWQYYEAKPAISRIIHSWDTAFKTKTGNDYSVCTVWGESRDGYFLLDCWRDRAEFPELKRVVIDLANRDKPHAILVEDAASGQSLLQELQRDTILPVLPIKVDKDKVARANAITPLIEAKRVFLPQSASWLFDYVEELSSFPAGAHDDIVDSTTQALIWMSESIETPKILAGVKSGLKSRYG